MSIINPALAAAIAATGVPLSADYAPQPATPRWHQLRGELASTFHLYMQETVRTGAVDKLDEVIAEALLEGTAEIRSLKAELERLAFLERTTLPELRRTIQHHQDGKKRWRDRAERAEARLSAVLNLCDREQRNAMRWQDPIPVPEWVAPVQRAALGDDKQTEAGR